MLNTVCCFHISSYLETTDGIWMLTLVFCTVLIQTFFLRRESETIIEPAAIWMFANLGLHILYMIFVGMLQTEEI